MKTTADTTTRTASLTRAYLPLALVAVGLMVALIGAARIAERSTEVVVEIGQGSGAMKKTTDSAGSPWAFVIVGCVVAIAGCTLQVVAWRMISNSGGPRQGEAPESLTLAAQPRSPTNGQEPPRTLEASMPGTPTTS